MNIEEALEIVARWDSFEMCSADEFDAVDALACAVRRLREPLADDTAENEYCWITAGRVTPLRRDYVAVMLKNERAGLAKVVEELRADRDRLARELERFEKREPHVQNLIAVATAEDDPCARGASFLGDVDMAASIVRDFFK